MRKSSNGENVLYGREFIRMFAARAGMDYEEARNVTAVFLQMLTEMMSSNISVCFRNFGVFRIRATSGRPARNPRTMEDYMIPEGYKPEFKASRFLRQTVDGQIKAAEAESRE